MTIVKLKWKFAVDRGGTFTDVIGLDPSGRFHKLKLLSSSPDYKDPTIEGIKRMLGLKQSQRLPGEKIEAIRLGTTVATNALLERKGGKVALLISKGFLDLLDIGCQSRPDIFSLCIKKPKTIYSMVIEVDERINQNGEILKNLDLQKLEEDIKKIKLAKVDAIAVVFMHSWKNPAHELFCEKILKQNSLKNIFLSHKTMNLIKIVNRGQSTVVDAYLHPVIENYINKIKTSVRSIPIEFIQSSGGLSASNSFKGKDAILSGPAGGVIAVSKIAGNNEIEGAIGFDMGGTSTDVSRYEGRLEKVYERIIGGILLQTEMLNITTIASGGGSILWFDGQRMRVGPESAGANPGPACYGFGGPLTITDANLLTGRIIPGHFPKTFGYNRDSPLNMDIVKRKFFHLTEEINVRLNNNFTPQEAALGFIRIANEKMATAINETTVSKGFDVRNYALVCFGGASGQHACQVANLLDIDKIIFHPLSSVMSAYGIGFSRPTKKSTKSILLDYSKENHDKSLLLFKKMEQALFLEFKDKEAPFFMSREIDLRPKGADTFFTLEFRKYEDTLKSFKNTYLRRFGFYTENMPIEAVNLRVEVQEKGDFFSTYSEKINNKKQPTASVGPQKIYYPGGLLNAQLYLKNHLPSLTKIKGPACIVDGDSTLVIDPGFKATRDKNGIIFVKRVSKNRMKVKAYSGSPDPVLLEVFNNLFMSIAIKMGLTLKNSSHSVNIKERLDFSCALFDSIGNLVANAPHQPVHLGSMADTVKAIIESHIGKMKPGDLYLSNNPYHGGSHLPDMTVVCPVFSKDGRIIFFTGSRGHHADIGGKTPGSMPPVAKHIDEEGILIDGTLIVRDKLFREEELAQLLSMHKYPARNIKERIFDLKAQIASCQKGACELKKVIEIYGWDVVRDYMGYIQENATYSVKHALSRFLKKNHQMETTFQDHLDDGTPLKVKITIKGGANPPETVEATIDFTGTGVQHKNDNLNTPISVTRSAALYVLRLLTEEDIPLNSGCLTPINLIIPKGTILSPVYPLPVASGNVETSQRIVDTLLGALGVAAASQGTMNNLLFEVEGDTPYYETIAGGSGAIDGCPGASGVQIHMTNTRITDPEILEFRHPGVRLERFILRKGSGGNGLYPGGEGTIREIKFLKPAALSIISERRVYAPYGMAGGKPGGKGVNLLKKANGDISKLSHRVTMKVNKGDSVIIKTPGGGGYGEKLC